MRLLAASLVSKYNRLIRGKLTLSLVAPASQSVSIVSFQLMANTLVSGSWQPVSSVSTIVAFRIPANTLVSGSWSWQPVSSVSTIVSFRLPAKAFISGYWQPVSSVSTIVSFRLPAKAFISGYWQPVSSVSIIISFRLLANTLVSGSWQPIWLISTVPVSSQLRLLASSLAISTSFWLPEAGGWLPMLQSLIQDPVLYSPLNTDPRSEISFSGSLI